MQPRLPHSSETGTPLSSAESVVLDRDTELATPYLEHPSTCRLVDQVATPRPWKMPVPLRARHFGFRDLGIHSPSPGPSKSEALALAVRGFPSLLTYPGSRQWLVLTVAMPGGVTPTDPFAGEPPHSRVDGDGCKGSLIASSKGQVYMGYIDLGRGTLSAMASRVLALEPESRILVRLLPRYTAGAVRWFPHLGAIQFWSAV